MSKTVAKHLNQATIGPGDRLDALSTRLMVDGVSSIKPSDLDSVIEAASAAGNTALEKAALALADRLQQSVDIDPRDLEATFADALQQLQNLLDCSMPLQPNVADDLCLREDTPEASAGGPRTLPSLAADEDLVREFILESIEHLSMIEGQTLLLEKDSADTETLNAIFRAFHTIKGLAGFLEFATIQSLAHEVETLLDLARNAKLTVTSHVIDVVLESTDVVRHELQSIELRLAGKSLPPSRVDEALLERVRNASVGGTNISNPAISDSTDGSRMTRQAQEPATIPAKQTIMESAKTPDSSSIRIDTGKLDQLMDMVGEMVIAQTLIGHSPALASVQDARLLRDLTQLARITTDVQKITTGMRMVPIGTQFQKTARLVRDLSRRAHKTILFETSGEETELDKSIAEELSDPLLHMVRNSIDHGIELPKEREAAGKDPTAHIRIAAYHQSGQIVVEISDDGRGLNREKILAKAKQNGLIQAGRQLSDNEIFLLIFEPGFSTAEKVTDISGRGVGMDVVRKHVQKLRGRIDIQSKAGEGTTFFIKLPLTLAIIEGLIVVVGEQRYIAPIVAVKEMFRPGPETLSTVQGKGEVALVHGALLPIVRLHRRFDVAPRTSTLSEGILVVVESQGKQFCLFVDDLLGKQEVVIKSLGQSFKHVVGVAGCGILGDGRVGLILELDAIGKGRGL